MSQKVRFDPVAMKRVFVNVQKRTNLPLPLRKVIVFRDDFTCQRCGKKAKIQDVREYHDWFRSPMGRELQLNAFYIVRKGIVSYPFVKVLRYENPYEDSTDVIFEYISSNGFEVDHIIPVRRGGGDNPKNLQLLCHDCHVEKSMEDRTGFKTGFYTGSNTMFRYEDPMPSLYSIGALP
jgi:hypothetical protein